MEQFAVLRQARGLFWSSASNLQMLNTDAPGMAIRHYSADGRLKREIPMPEALAKDGVGALAVCADGTMLCGISAPGTNAMHIG